MLAVQWVGYPNKDKISATSADMYAAIHAAGKALGATNNTRS